MVIGRGERSSVYCFSVVPRLLVDGLFVCYVSGALLVLLVKLKNLVAQVSEEKQGIVFVIFYSVGV